MFVYRTYFRAFTYKCYGIGISHIAPTVVAREKKIPGKVFLENVQNNFPIHLECGRKICVYKTKENPSIYFVRLLTFPMAMLSKFNELYIFMNENLVLY